MALRRKRHKPRDDLEQARADLDKARAQHAAQARLREQESEYLIKRMERLAADNHLAALVWDVVTGGDQ